MTPPLLATKLSLPPRRAGLVPRPRLCARLTAGLEAGRRLTLVSASAGYGKTTLVAEWVRSLPAGDQAAVAWLTLDEADADPARFLAYLRAALQTALPDLPPPAPAEAAMPGEARLADLINSVAAAGRPAVLVLDDYHAVKSLPVHAQLAFLVEHQPAHLRLLIATREDPPLPLARLRAGGQMVELRQTDLQFTVAEAVEFLGQAAGAPLTSADIHRLHARTEGWIAGLQLAALSLPDGADVARRVEAFAGSQRHVLDYLIDEVFRWQPPDVQNFLLRTALLDRFCADLCDAVLADQPAGPRVRCPSSAVLEHLERANLFIVPLDEARQWYRYHHLFADLLRHRLEATLGDEVNALHQRASRWCAAHGLAADATRHALAGADWEAAASLIHHQAEELLRLGQIATLLEWFSRLPEGVVRAQPELGLDQAWALLTAGQHAAGEARLDQAEAAAGADDPALLGRLTAARAFLARERGDVAQAAAQSHRALALLPESDYVTRGVLAANLGLGYWHLGRLAEAEPLLHEARRAALATHNDYARLTAEIFLARTLAVRGQLRAAAERHRQLIAAGPRAPILALAYLDLSALHFEWNDLGRAADYWGPGQALSQQAGQAEFQVAALLLEARWEGARGAARALDVIQQAHTLAQTRRLPGPLLGRVAAAGVEVALALGDQPAAEQWAGQMAAGASPHPFYRFLGLTQARLQLARGERPAAAAALGPLAAQAGAAGWGYGLIAARALQALAADSRAAAAAYLAEALELAQGEGLVRTFVDLGEPLRALLPEAARGRLAGYGGRLLAAFAPERRGAPAEPAESFSTRELEVLRLLAQGQTNAEISQALFVSVNTIKTHLEHIYDKLGVSGRRQAVARARQLGQLN